MRMHSNPRVARLLRKVDSVFSCLPPRPDPDKYLAISVMGKQQKCRTFLEACDWLLDEDGMRSTGFSQSEDVFSEINVVRSVF